jgi:hypothetical protein
LQLGQQLIGILDIRGRAYDVIERTTLLEQSRNLILVADIGHCRPHTLVPKLFLGGIRSRLRAADEDDFIDLGQQPLCQRQAHARTAADD